MKIRVRLGIASALGLIVAVGSGFRARAQVGPSSFVANAYNVDGSYQPFNPGGLQRVAMPPQGVWAEVINVTSRWIVVQNQAGQQFPISSDRVRQFLVRWPHSINQLTPQSVIEVLGPDAGSNVVIADHIDVYESDAQRLVSPTVTSLFGYNQALSGLDADQVGLFGTTYQMTPEEYAIPNRLHIVGNSLNAGDNVVRIAGIGQKFYTVQPSANGMSATRITLGNNSYAKRGDLVYIVAENVGPRSLDVSQMVLYKKIPFRSFQP